MTFRIIKDNIECGVCVTSNNELCDNLVVQGEGDNQILYCKINNCVQEQVHLKIQTQSITFNKYNKETENIRNLI